MVLSAPLLLWSFPSEAIWPFGSDEKKVPVEGAPPGDSPASLLSRAVQIPTVNPPGDERPLAQLFVDEFARAGIETRLVETPSPGGASPRGRAAAWARVPGNGTRAPIVLLSHLDVVPAEGKGWAFDPFSGAVVGGYVVGRGALDAKGVGVVHLLTLIELAKRATPLDRDVIFLATPDEETGGRYGAAYLLEAHRDLLGGAEYLLTEGGGILMSEIGSPNIWGVTIAEKAPCWMRLRTRGVAGHASSAGPGGAVPRLVRALARIAEIETPVRVIPEVERMFREMAPLAAPEDRSGFQSLSKAFTEEPAFRDRFLSSGRRAALVRNTVTLTVVHAGSSTNVVPPEARAEIDSRVLPGESCMAFIQSIRDVVDDPEVEIEPKLAFESRTASADTPLFEAIEKVSARIDPGAFVVPRVIAGFTDAHYFRDLGIVAYGFVPRWLPARETRGVHGVNERISVENLERGVDAMLQILDALDAAEAQTP